MATYDLNGKVALVTGAQRGIGLETAKALHRRGAKVVLADLDGPATEAAAATLGPDALGVAADVTDRAMVEAAVAAAVERFGRLDVVVANAGIAPDPGTARVMDRGQFDAVLDVNLLGVWKTVAAALPQISENGGHVVVVSSVYAFVNGVGNAPYAMAKAGVEALGRTLRTELALHGASATVAYFGFIDTTMVHDSVDKHAQGDEMMKLIPAPMRKRLPPSAAGEGIAAAIASRSATVILPRRWRGLWALRGLLNPVIDELSTRDKRAMGLLRKLDTRG